MEYEQTQKLKGKQKSARNKVKELFTYNTWDKSISVGVVGEKFDIIFPQVQLTFSLCILDIQSMFWEPNCIGWNGHNQMKMLAFIFYQGKSTASHKTCFFQFKLKTGCGARIRIFTQNLFVSFIHKMGCGGRMRISWVHFFWVWKWGNDNNDHFSYAQS
jgi:hypothetical protein